MSAFDTPLDVAWSLGSEDQLLSKYANLSIFGRNNSLVLRDNPYRRPIRVQDFSSYHFGRPLGPQELNSASALAAQRMLLNIYETDLMFLPKGPLQPVRPDFETFYADETRFSGEAIRPVLEKHAFEFLDREIDVPGNWTIQAMKAYFDHRLAEANQGESAVVNAIMNAGDREKAADSFLVQLAGGFLTEASAMARNVLGSFGPALSELFKVLIDENGYGVHETKHSNLFEAVLRSRGLSSDIHAYWQFYLPTSMALFNYFHYVSRSHSRFFQYLGALYYTKSTLPRANTIHSKMLSEIFGDAVDRSYFDEHAHIDAHHSIMALERIIEPVVELCGDEVIPEIIRGFEEFRLLKDLADEDLVAQIGWESQPDRYLALAQEQLWSAENPDDLQWTVFTEKKNELSVLHVHDEDELFAVRTGELDFIAGHKQNVRLMAGEAIVIPKGRSHGSIIRSESCTYAVRALTANERVF